MPKLANEIVQVSDEKTSVTKRGPTRRASLVFAAALGFGLAARAWPVFAADTPSETPAPDLGAVRAKLAAQDYRGALALLKPLAQSNPHPDVFNLIGYSYRKSGDMAQAAIWYQKALDLDPNHRGALEYQGIMFVQTGQLDKAKANLARLNKLCFFGCEEYRDLKAAIAASSRAS